MHFSISLALKKKKKSRNSQRPPVKANGFFFLPLFLYFSYFFVSHIFFSSIQNFDNSPPKKDYYSYLKEDKWVHQILKCPMQMAVSVWGWDGRTFWLTRLTDTIAWHNLAQPHESHHRRILSILNKNRSHPRQCNNFQKEPKAKKKKKKSGNSWFCFLCAITRLEATPSGGSELQHTLGI